MESEGCAWASQKSRSAATARDVKTSMSLLLLHVRGQTVLRTGTCTGVVLCTILRARSLLLLAWLPCLFPLCANLAQCKCKCSKQAARYRSSAGDPLNYSLRACSARWPLWLLLGSRCAKIKRAKQRHFPPQASAATPRCTPASNAHTRLPPTRTRPLPSTTEQRLSSSTLARRVQQSEPGGRTARSPPHRRIW